MEKHHRARPRRALPSDSGELLNKLLCACKAGLQMGWGGCSWPHAWGCPTCRGVGEDRAGSAQTQTEQQDWSPLAPCLSPRSITARFSQPFLGKFCQPRAPGSETPSAGLQVDGLKDQQRVLIPQWCEQIILASQAKRFGKVRWLRSAPWRGGQLVISPPSTSLLRAGSAAIQASSGGHLDFSPLLAWSTAALQASAAKHQQKSISH